MSAGIGWQIAVAPAPISQSCSGSTRRSWSNRAFADYPLRVGLATERIRTVEPVAVILLNVDVHRAERDFSRHWSPCRSLVAPESGSRRQRIGVPVVRLERSLEGVDRARHPSVRRAVRSMCDPVAQSAAPRTSGTRSARAGGYPGMVRRREDSQSRPRRPRADIAATMPSGRPQCCPLCRISFAGPGTQEDGESVYGWEHRLREAAVIAAWPVGNATQRRLQSELRGVWGGPRGSHRQTHRTDRSVERIRGSGDTKAGGIGRAGSLAGMDRVAQ